MENIIRRIFVKKKEAFALEASQLCTKLKEDLGIEGLKSIEIYQRYDVSGLEDTIFERAAQEIFAEPMVDDLFYEICPTIEGQHVFALEYLPGQYDQRADSSEQCLRLLVPNLVPVVKTAKVIVITGSIQDEEINKIKTYLINPVECREAILSKPTELDASYNEPSPISILAPFIELDAVSLQGLYEELGLAMNLDDFLFCQTYFKEVEKRNPTLTEIKVIDTYWSDHCRHTTFATELTEIIFEKSPYTKPIEETYEALKQARKEKLGKDDTLSLMDIALSAMKELRQSGQLKNMDISDEINACSIVVPVLVDGQYEDYLVMFKNETHNHPTEIEPFGGAATCLGGAIRDPLSGRSYVYQAMRITGSGDPRKELQETLVGKLPQKKITVGAANGYSSYGNQIGLATGQVKEIYHEGYVAKRMEIGAVIGAVPKAQVVRENPEAGDVVILLGGKTGRDGCGGATGSSKAHTLESLSTCGAEVQKGNPVIERKIQRLFRNEAVTKLIKRCNDFGAGGVAVAIGELAEGLSIDLDRVPKKYEGLDGTELAISESQERMALVVAKKDAQKMLDLAHEENLQATVVAEVTEAKRLQMFWQKKSIVNLSREFLDTNGIKQKAKVLIKAPKENPLTPKALELDFITAWKNNMIDLNVCSQKGLVERFDSTIGGNTVLLPFGGQYQMTPEEGMVARIPVLNGETTTSTMMTFGFNPELSSHSPFHGSIYAIVEAVAKSVALGGDYQKIYLTLQEYFEKLGQTPEKWGKPFSALLGAYYAQKALGIAAIGGKDSMSGSYHECHVPPTLVAFAVNWGHCDDIMSAELKNVESKLVWLKASYLENGLPDFDVLKRNFNLVTNLIKENKASAVSTVKYGGLSAALSKMAFGNQLGIRFEDTLPNEEYFKAFYGSFILEINKDVDIESVFKTYNYECLGEVIGEPSFIFKETIIPLVELCTLWEKPLNKIFPSSVPQKADMLEIKPYQCPNVHLAQHKVAKPKVLMPVFPGTNCEYDTLRAFERAGAQGEIVVIKNLSDSDILQSVEEISKKMKQAQILMLPGGFSAGDEPDGSGKFMATFFRHPKLQEDINSFLKKQDGLVLGICNGFQALIKLGLLPYGEVRSLTKEDATLTYNQIGRHVSGYVETKIISNLSPWLMKTQVGDIHAIPVSHGEGRFVASTELVKELSQKGQIATQYVDFTGAASPLMPYNPNGSVCAIEGIASPDGKVLGKMGHSERVGYGVAKNIIGAKEQGLFASGVAYFKN
jgi:phosphoribosylformylglycinamidine synthase